MNALVRQWCIELVKLDARATKYAAEIEAQGLEYETRHDPCGTSAIMDLALDMIGVPPSENGPDAFSRDWMHQKALDNRPNDSDARAFIRWVENELAHMDSWKVKPNPSLQGTTHLVRRTLDGVVGHTQSGAK